MNLLPCPFCGGSAEMVESNRQDRRVLDMAGKCRKRVHVDHRVECYSCGASGPPSIASLNWHSEVELTDDMVIRSKEAAAFEWNKRQPIHDDAYRLVNALITGALRSVGGFTEPK